MAMSKASLKARFIDKMEALGFNQYSGRTGGWFDYFFDALADAIVEEIQTNARCSGADSRGDTHDNVQIV